jgi:MFS family permease
MVANLVPNIFAMPYQALMPVFQKDVLGVGADGLGILLAAPGLGAVIATLGLASVSHTVRRKGLLLIGALLLLGFFLVGFSFMTSLPMALLMLVGVGGCQVFYAATTNTLIQTIVPDALRGRVMSIYLLDHGLSPLGSMFAGIGAHFFGAPATVAVMGAMVGLLALVVAWRLPDLREIRA